MKNPREKTTEAGVYKIRSSAGRVSYAATWREPSGLQKERRFSRWEDARAWRHRMLGDRDRCQYRDPRLGQEPLGEYLQRFLSDADLSRSTLSTYRVEARRYVLPRFERAPIASITPQDVRGFMSDLAKREVGTRTIQLCHQLLRGCSVRPSKMDSSCRIHVPSLVAPRRGERSTRESSNRTRSGRWQTSSSRDIGRSC
jgi:integrase-like protein